MSYFLQGLLLGIAYVAPIGTQNMYLINTSLQEKWTKSLQVALIIVFFDMSLALACFWGIGLLVDKYLLFKGAMLLLGSIAICYIGFSLALARPQEIKTTSPDSSLIAITMTCFAVTWLNPQAIIDGSLLLGGIYATLPTNMVVYFIFGVCLASLIWFTGLACFISIFKNKFNPLMLKYLNSICGGIIVLYGLKLGYTFIELFF